MNQDALTLAAIRDELAGLLVSGRVQRIVRPTELSLGLEIYAGRRYQVLLSAEAEASRIALLNERPRRGTDTASPLQLLLRKYVQGARVLAIEQPELERALHWRFGGPEGQVDLVCEVMGRLSNLILVGEDGAILDAAKRIPRHLNRYRVILPGAPYVPPPAQGKAHPLALSAAELGAALARQSGALQRRLVDAVWGVSPLLAREIVHRAVGQPEAAWPLDQATLARLHGELQALMNLTRTHAWAPSVGFQRQGGARIPVAYAPYALTHLDAWEPVALVSQAAALSLGQQRPPDPYARPRQDLVAAIDGQIERLRARLRALQESAASPEELDALQFRGSAVLALAWAIVPGQDSLTVTRGQITGEVGPEADKPLTIPLDPRLSPAENAQAIFRAYRKREAAARHAPARIAEVEAELDYLEQLRTDAALAEDRPALEAVAVALEETGYVPQSKRRSRPAASAPLTLEVHGLAVVVGRNSRQNDEVTFRLAGPRDLWLHVRGAPGAHVILRSAGEPVSEEALQQAAGLAAYYSALRHEARAPVDVTERRHVRRLPGGRPGMVTYREERTLFVAPRAPSDIGG